MPEEDEETYILDIDINGVSMSVESHDQEWVDKKFEEVYERLEENGHFEDDTYHAEASAGWLMAHIDGNSPEEAVAMWEEMWVRMLEDVEELSESEREQAGLAR